MASTIQTEGSYKSKKTGQDVKYSFEYDVLSNDEKARLDGVYPDGGNLVQRMLKIDAGNTAREKAKTANNDSTRVLQTEEQKAQAKVKRQSDKAILAKLAEKGIASLDELDSLLG